MSDWQTWGLRSYDGRIVRRVTDQDFEGQEVSGAEILSALAEKTRMPPEKSLTDSAFQLLLAWIGCNVRPTTAREDNEDLPREAVRWCRALEAEVEHATERPEQKPRAARRAPDDDEEAYP